MEKLNNLIITECDDIKTVPSAKGRYEKMNNRRCYGLSFCISGKITYTHNGKKFISDHKNAVILPKGATYTLYGNEKGLFPCINFDCTEKLCDTFVLIPLPESESLIKKYNQMLSLSLFEGNQAKIMSIFYDILHKLSSYSNVNKTIMPAISFIEKNFHNPNLRNQDLANECNISEVYFRKLFIKQFNTTPKQFIMDIRIQKAKQLLKEGGLKINAISEQCGFSNSYHFCRSFKEKTGLSPTEYMKQNKAYKI